MNTTKLLITIILGGVLIVGIVYLVQFLNQNPNIQSGQNNQAFSIKDYAEQRGYKDYFKYQNDWYTNIDGVWKKVKDYALEKGYDSYFTSHGNWYLLIDGVWKSVKEYADEKGYKTSFLFKGIKFQYVGGKWLRLAK